MDEDLDDETVVWDPASGAVVRLDPTASVVWHALDGSRSLGQLSEDLAERFGTDVDRVRDDVVALVELLSASGHVVSTAAHPPA